MFHLSGDNSRDRYIKDTTTTTPTSDHHHRYNSTRPQSEQTLRQPPPTILDAARSIAASCSHCQPRRTSFSCSPVFQSQKAKIGHSCARVPAVHLTSIRIKFSLWSDAGCAVPPRPPKATGSRLQAPGYSSSSSPLSATFSAASVSISFSDRRSCIAHRLCHAILGSASSASSSATVER